MRNLAVILLLCLSISSYSQSTFKVHREAWKALGLYTASVGFQAAGDALKDSGRKPLGHAMEAAGVATLLSVPFVVKIERGDWPYYLSMYVGTRFMFYDYTYNKTAGLPLTYMGHTSVYDNMMGTGWSDGFFMGRVVFFTATVSFGVKNIY